MNDYWSTNIVPGLMPEVYFLPYPYTHRNPFLMEGEKGEKAVINYIETMLDDVESGIPKPACVVLEAIQVRPLSLSLLSS